MKPPPGSHLFSTHDFSFINAKGKAFTIRICSPVGGVANNQVVAAPVAAPGATVKTKFRAAGATKEEALNACMRLLNDLDDPAAILD